MDLLNLILLGAVFVLGWLHGFLAGRENLLTQIKKELEEELGKK